MADLNDIRQEKGFTARAVLVGMALVLVWLLYDCTLAVDSGLNRIEVLYLIGFGALFTLFVVQFFNNLLDETRRLSAHELTVIYTMVAVAIPWGILIRASLEAPMKMLVMYTSASDKSVDWLTPFWVTKSLDARDMFRLGGKMPWEIPWRLWAVPIAYWSAILLSFQAFAIFTVLFLRRLFVDEEKLPFPMAQVGESIIDYKPTRSETEGARRLSMAVRVAFIVGILFCLPGIASVTPDSQSPIPMNPSHYGTSTGLIPGLSVTLSWDPFILCFLMFFPFDVLFTVTVVYVGFQILVPMVCLWMGIPAPNVSGWMLNVCGVGGLVGLAFWTFFFNRRLLWRMVKRVFTGGRDATTDDPVSPRVIVLGVVISLGVFMALFIAGIVDWEKPFTETDLYKHLGYHVISLAVVVFILVTLVVAILRQSGECGWVYHSPWSVGKVLAYVHNHYLKVPGREHGIFQTQASFLSIAQLIHFGAYHNAFGPHLHVMNALRIASGTGTRTRDVMKAVLLVMILGLVIVVPGYLIAVHYYGFLHGETSSSWFNFWNYEEPGHGIAYNAVPSIFNKVYPWFSVPIGVVIIGFVMYMKRERVGWPFSPVGVVIATGLSYFSSYSTPVIWLPIIIVLVVKRVIYRWFGVRFFRERVIPVVLFAMMGLMTGMFIYKIIFMALGRGFMRPY